MRMASKNFYRRFFAEKLFGHEFIAFTRCFATPTAVPYPAGKADARVITHDSPTRALDHTTPRMTPYIGYCIRAIIRVIKTRSSGVRAAARGNGTIIATIEVSERTPITV